MFEKVLTNEHMFGKLHLERMFIYYLQLRFQSSFSGGGFKMVYRLKNKRKFFTLIFLLIVVVLLLIGTVSSTGKNSQHEQQFITVRPGDTLWEIASNHRGTMEIRQYIFKLKKVNNLNDSIIYAGQRLELP